MELSGPAYSDRLCAAEQYATTIILKEVPPTRFFHHLRHTAAVAEQCRRFAIHYALSPEDTEALLIAAWFHDTGYARGEEGHEAESAHLARSFLSRYSVSESFHTLVHSLILSTRFPPAPVSRLQEILCDADMNHLGSADYATWAAMLRRELVHHHHMILSDGEWAAKNLSFFQRHRYHTGYACSLWDNQKSLNMQALSLMQSS
jgi:predicted metal-dependent HD superfamily phosphohydrolase